MTVNMVTLPQTSDGARSPKHYKQHKNIIIIIIIIDTNLIVMRYWYGWPHTYR